MKRLILDIDETVCWTGTDGYKYSEVIDNVRQRIAQYRAMGFAIVFSSSRNMRKFEGNLGKINANTLPIIVEWLDRHGIEYDEIYVGKPWCGMDGFYVDDKAVRPIEFATMTYDEIRVLLTRSAAQLRAANSGKFD